MKPKNYKDLEKRILEQNENVMKLEDFTLTDENLETFIFYLLNKYTFDYNTIDENEDLVCIKGIIRRSLGSIYLISKYYFQNCTLKEVVNILLENIKNKVVGSYYCHSSKKRVYRIENYGVLGELTVDELGMTHEDYINLK